jgi:16S rRNA (uracil1498-N3)-methyltransferase
MALIPRFHCPLPLASGMDVLLPPTAARHVQVLRLQPGDTVTLFDGGQGTGHWAGGEFEATITRMGRSDVQVMVGAHRARDCEARRPVHLAVGMPANDRMDWLVEKATELGVASIQPLVTERTVLRLSGERALKKQAHWQGIAVAACEQCGRNRVPLVAPVLTFTEWQKTLPGQSDRAGEPGEFGEVRWVLSLAAGSRPLAAGIGALASPVSPVTVLSGPEGGLTAAEEQAARAQGFAAVALGPRVLRAETAALAALAALTLGQ